jgi:hypothetical protein
MLDLVKNHVGVPSVLNNDEQVPSCKREHVFQEPKGVFLLFYFAEVPDKIILQVSPAAGI